MKRRRFLRNFALASSGLFVPGIAIAPPNLGFQGSKGGVSLDPVATAWEARVIANGGTDPSVTYVKAVSDLVAGLKSDGIWTKMIFVHGVVPGPVVGINPPAASCYAPNTPILVGPSVNLLLNQLGQDQATIWPTAGSLKIDLNGLNNATSDIAVTPTAMWSSATNVGFSVYIFSNTNNQLFGSTDNTHGTYTNGPASGAWSVADGHAFSIFPTLAINLGLFSFNRSATNSLQIHGANSTNPPATLDNDTSTDATDPRQNTFTLYFHGGNSGSPSTNGNYQLSFCCCHTALTLGDFTSLYNRVQAFRTTIGGGFI